MGRLLEDYQWGMAVDAHGRDFFFEPEPSPNFAPTNAEPGSQEKIEVMRLRVELGLPIHHQHDRKDYEGVKKTTARSSKKTEAAYGRRVYLTAQTVKRWKKVLGQ